MGALYNSADIYLMSPNADNMPLSLLECFAAGLPVVSSSAGGIPNIVEDQVSGLLFAPNDHQAMAACALRLLEEPGLASSSRGKRPSPVRQVFVVCDASGAADGCAVGVFGFSRRSRALDASINCGVNLLHAPRRRSN